MILFALSPQVRIPGVIPVQTIVPRMLAQIISKAPLNQEKVAFAWRAAVGPALAGATELVLDEGTLRVQARDRAWQRELQRAAATIRTRLDDLLGPGVVRALVVTAAAAPAAERRRRPEAIPPAKASGVAARAPKRPPSAGGLGSARKRR